MQVFTAQKWNQSLAESIAYEPKRVRYLFLNWSVRDNAPGSSWHVKGVVAIRAGAQGDVSGSVPHYSVPH